MPFTHRKPAYPRNSEFRLGAANRAPEIVMLAIVRRHRRRGTPARRSIPPSVWIFSSADYYFPLHPSIAPRARLSANFSDTRRGERERERERESTRKKRGRNARVPKSLRDNARGSVLLAEKFNNNRTDKDGRVSIREKYRQRSESRF